MCTVRALPENKMKHFYRIQKTTNCKKEIGSLFDYILYGKISRLWKKVPFFNFTCEYLQNEGQQYLSIPKKTKSRALSANTFKVIW